MSKIIRNYPETGRECRTCGEREGSGFESKDCNFEKEKV